MIVPIDGLDAEDRYGREPAHELTAERVFERQWALTLLERVLTGLKTSRPGRAKLPCSIGCDPRFRVIIWPRPTATSPPSLDLSKGRVRVAAHRLRARYRELLREEVSRTTDDAAGIDDEIADLLTRAGCEMRFFR